MKLLTLSLTLLAAANRAGAEGGKTVDLTTEHQKTLYALGLSIANDIAVFRLSPEELDTVQMGMRDSVAAKTPKLKLEDYFERLKLLLKGRRDQEVHAFLSAAAQEQGIQKFPSGLLYKETLAGTGPNAKPSDTVKVHYHGTRTDGTVFDSSITRGEPSQFPLSGVIRCWQEGIPLMKTGGKARLICPAHIAYGERGHPPAILPGATLIFDVELLAINP